ncbi:dihydroorotate dehydrogenase electron transfer subunit [Veillonella criceti]|uniref:Dihydroorotate dehydrogenase B (NAD(+)), electron transfer subunit n=1 Tax=Veillonella criceti TaxID=103891 RepID=A0A380NE89_9FIRM|nr:dihydroorotate dehydrogenase electron transfer subunit [Veillonella criceti]SUP37217.1 Dihydrdoorotate oxidase B, electron transfer subunit [Veillonella criceti]
MSGYVEMARVLRNEQIGADVWIMNLYAPKQAAEAEVGQFCNVRVTGGTAPLLRRPISYAGFDKEEGTITLLYRVVGTGTEMMTCLKEGDVLDCLGPLGSRFEMTDNMLLIGGGVGIAPMLCIASKLNDVEDTMRYTNEEDETVIQPVASRKATVVLGFRNESETFWADLFKDCPVDVYITTDDGSVGTKGFPTAIMGELIQSERGEVKRQLPPYSARKEEGTSAINGFTSVMTCGPTPMMKGVAKVAEEYSVPCQVSLEERMGCGTGGCLGCGCHGRGGKRYKVCKEGPVFPAEEVFFE